MTFRVRKASGEDIGAVFDLMTELAEFERATDEVETTAEQLARDYRKSCFELLVAEKENGTVAGMALFYPRYSTWKGWGIYLEDLVVRREERGKGMGRALLKAVIERAESLGAVRVDWQVLDWNTPAVEFYQKLGVEIEKEWWNCKLYIKDKSYRKAAK